MVDKFESIKYIGGFPYGRLVVNIKKGEEYHANDKSGTYHTEGIFSTGMIYFERKDRENANQIKKGKQRWSNYQQGPYSEGLSGLSLLCVVPLIGFNSYSIDFIEPNKKSSVFERMVMDTHNRAIFEEGGNVIDILLQNKWNNFASATFAFMFSIYLAYFVLYIICISFSYSVFGYLPGTTITSIAQLFCTSIMFGFIGVIFIQNLQRLLTSQTNWIISDHCSIVLRSSQSL